MIQTWMAEKNKYLNQRRTITVAHKDWFREDLQSDSFNMSDKFRDIMIWFVNLVDSIDLPEEENNKGHVHTYNVSNRLVERLDSIKLKISASRSEVVRFAAIFHKLCQMMEGN